MDKRSREALSRRAFLKAGQSAAAAGAILSAGGLRTAAAQQKVIFRLAHVEAIGSPLTEACEKWVQRLNAESKGRLDAQHFPAGQLGSYTQLIEGNRIGTIQGTTGGPDTEEAVAPEIAVTAGAPGFIYRDEAHVDRVLQGPIGQEVSDIARKKTGVEFVAYGEVGFRHLLAVRPVETLGDLKGLKIRVPEIKLWVDFWKKLGANPTPLPYAEQYSSLSAGVIDGLEADVFSIQGYRWHEQAKHMTLTSHWFLPKAIRVNARWLDALPEDLRKVMRDSAKEVFAEQRTTNRANTSKVLDDLKKSGMVVHELKDTDKWREAAEPLYGELAARGPAVKEMIAKIRSLATA
jgi:tripartite ATP-independent transporter DctP family solute receptor